MQAVYGANLIDYVVNVISPKEQPPKEGVDSVTHGVWRWNPRLDVFAWPDWSYSFNEGSMSALKELIEEVCLGQDFPPFGVSMTSNQYQEFVFQYFEKMRVHCVNGGLGNKFRDYFWRKNKETGLDEYWVPDMNYSSSKFFEQGLLRKIRTKAINTLSVMCEDPCQFNRGSALSNLNDARFNKREAYFYLARMGVFTSGRDVDGLIGSELREALLERFKGDGFLLSEIRSSLYSLGRERGLRLIPTTNYEELFVNVSSSHDFEGVHLLDFQADMPNDRGWSVRSLVKKKDRRRGYRGRTYDTLKDLWCMNFELPTVLTMQGYWRYLAQNPANKFGVFVDQGSRVIFFPDENGGMPLAESSNTTIEHIDDFVVADK